MITRAVASLAIACACASAACATSSLSNRSGRATASNGAVEPRIEVAASEAPEAPLSTLATTDFLATNPEPKAAPLAPDVPRIPKGPSFHIEPSVAPPATSLDEWSTRYPDAARGLERWASANPRAAALVREWDDTSTEQVEVLTEWAITNRYDSLDVFLERRQTWTTLGAMSTLGFRDALDGYLAWCRSAPRAATELVRHPHGLSTVAARMFAAAAR